MQEIERVCVDCAKHFKPMTDKQWEIIAYEHELMSIRHRSYVATRTTFSRSVSV